MSASVMLGLSIAVVSFWAMGAYNRLMRLRSQGMAAFAAMEGWFAQYVLLVNVNAPEGMGAATETGHGAGACSTAAAWADLKLAAEQFNVALQVAHTQALHGPTLRALQTALATLLSSWIRLRELPLDLAGPALPLTLQVQWEQLAFQAELARTEFNHRLACYNEAISQFPALLMARILGFKPAQPIEG